MSKIIHQNKNKKINSKISSSRPRIWSDKRLNTKPHQQNFDQSQAIHSIAARTCTCAEPHCALVRDCLNLTELNELNDKRPDNLIKLGVTIDNLLLEALVDSGATSNYMSKRVFDKLQFSPSSSEFSPSTHSVRIADRTIVSPGRRLDH